MLKLNNVSIIKKEISDLHTHFTETIDKFSYDMKVKSINFNLNIQENAPVVFWDIDTIKEHVFHNIFSNIISFLHLDGNIHMDVEHDHKEVIITIKDDAIGVPYHKRKKMFTHNSSTLYSVSVLINMHNGKMKVDEGIDGTGLGFKITLPIV